MQIGPEWLLKMKAEKIAQKSEETGLSLAEIIERREAKMDKNKTSKAKQKSWHLKN
jgi:hypothetical protein